MLQLILIVPRSGDPTVALNRKSSFYVEIEKVRYVPLVVLLSIVAGPVVSLSARDEMNLKLDFQ